MGRMNQEKMKLKYQNGQNKHIKWANLENQLEIWARLTWKIGKIDLNNWPNQLRKWVE